MPLKFRVPPSPATLADRAIVDPVIPPRPTIPARAIALILVVMTVAGTGLIEAQTPTHPGAPGLAHGSTPPAERWLPTNTLAFVTCPDVTSAGRAWSAQAPVRFWADPSMKPFRDHCLDRIRGDLLGPVAELTGVDLTSLVNLAEGQITLAQVAQGDSQTAQVLLVDTGSRTNELNAFLSSLPTARRDPTTSLATNRLGDDLFLTLRPESARWRKVFREAFSTEAGDGTENRSIPAPATASAEVIHVGARGPLLWVGTSSSALEQSIERLAAARPWRPAGTSGPGAPENLVTVLQGRILPAGVARWFPQPPSHPSTSPAPLPVRARLRQALGLSQIRGASATIRAGSTGWYLDLDLDLPSADRRGLFKLVEFRSAPADPPPFIGADAVRFTRWRLPGPTAWANFERLLLDADPALLGVLQLFTGYAGRTEDPDFDFQTRIIDRLGDDWILASYPLPPDGAGSVGETGDLLIAGTPRAKELLEALTLVTAPTYLATFLPPDSPPPVQERRRVQGSDFVTLAMPPMPWLDDATGAVHFASREGWVAISTRAALLERFLAGPPTHTLASRPDFQRAAATAGGTEGGLLSFRDERAWAATLFADWAGRAARRELPAGLRWLTLSETTAPVAAALARWLDFARLPRFERVSRHFGLGIQSGRVTTNGFHLRVFRPIPPPP